MPMQPKKKAPDGGASKALKKKSFVRPDSSSKAFVAEGAPNELVCLNDGQLITDSIKIAAVHGKRHDDVLRLIRRRIVEAGEWGVRNFAETRGINPQNGQSYPVFTMTKDGYQFMVGKMTGKKAVQHQIAFIEAFNVVARRLEDLMAKRERDREQLQMRDAVSRSRGTEGSHLMHQRRREKRHIEEERTRLDEPVQLELLLREVLA